MTENTNANSALTYSEVIRAIEKLTEEEKQIIFSMLSVNDLTTLLSSQENIDFYIGEARKCVNRINKVICGIAKLHKHVNNLTNDTDYIVGNYEKLTDDQKKEIALRLLNNGEFQKDCCEILVSDMERIAKSDATVKAINDVFNITGWCKNLIKQGIGMNHHYEV